MIFPKPTDLVPWRCARISGRLYMSMGPPSHVWWDDARITCEDRNKACAEYAVAKPKVKT